MHETDSIFSKEEQTLILNFAKAMKVEFCEFDVLRHSDGRIFIIDVNKTPYGPPAGLAESDIAVAKLSEAFQRLVTSDW
jgi:glutathione synthase/RimK-type ligase-like ATP-grasp enzyme